MTDAFTKLNALLEEKGTLTDNDIAAVEGVLGPLSDGERLWLSVEVHDRRRRDGAAITLEQYVQATRELEENPPGSPEHETARQIVDAFENAA